MYGNKNERVCVCVFRYTREYVVTGEPYAGFDRHNGEIAGFFLDR